MDTRRAVLDALSAGPVAGPELAERVDVSRAAVWKQIEALRENGFRIEATEDGYVVRSVPSYGADAIRFGLDAPYEIAYYESIGSTNDRARELAEEGVTDVAVVADEQTGGRGRLDREWTAPSGGVYSSLVIRPDLPPAHAAIVTLAAAVATTDACRELGVDARIKWPNDVLHPDGQGDRGGAKLAGILTEMTGEADRVSWMIVGTGVNANVDVDELPPGATSLRSVLGSDIDRRRFLQRLLERVHELIETPTDVLPAWREHAMTIGERVRIETTTDVIEGTAIDVEFPGALVVRTEAGRRRILSGDCQHLRPIGAADATSNGSNGDTDENPDGDGTRSPER
ncbi:biotin--[acetyl-CoA-carboxylase] ligase [Halopenitus sp. H-Gu1]|uniref:biotin--[acetyl-CoA-carboxylase] ligase n=1 Tax=Halopenitus sp. H-Gu1 TaxID=3242697 RepID=UPI00359D280F